jgi:hypothetical protein
MAIATKLPPTIERIKELLDYDPETGTFRWRVRRSSSCLAGQAAGTAHIAGYISIGIDGRIYLAHRLVWLIETGEWPVEQIDHKDEDRTNNRFGNLREASNGQNMQNRGAIKTNTSGYKGVTWHKKAGKWMAQINANDRHIYLGLYLTAEEAAEAYRLAALEHHGEFTNIKAPKNIEGAS